LEEIREKLNQFNVETCIPIATEVYRKSPNANEILEKYGKVLGTKIRIVSPEEEAKYGYRSGMALTGYDPNDLVVFDSGAGSF
jgi:exopolyphosphatase/pppGpp-phosphohydrolase